jgi:SAM-dependent methyltransferase
VGQEHSWTRRHPTDGLTTACAPPAAQLDIHDWIEELAPDQRVLDVGSGAGSFPDSQFRCTMVAIDEDPQTHVTAPAGRGCSYWVCARSDRIPFGDASFDLIVAHHVLEHIARLDQTLDEVARVLKPAGRCFFSFPDGYSLCDGIYRWLYEGGGHVNRLRKDETVRRIETRLGVRLVRWQKLYASYTYLRRLMELRDDPPADLQKRLRLVCRLPRRAIGLAQHALYAGTRVADRLAGTSLALYGWALFFEKGSDGAGEEQPGFINVCPYCGVGQPAAGVVRRRLVLCQCRACGRCYPYTGVADLQTRAGRA